MLQLASDILSGKTQIYAGGLVTIDPARLKAALQTTRGELLAQRNEQGHWTGELSSSALATATAVVALQIVQRETNADHHDLINGGLQWLALAGSEAMLMSPSGSFIKSYN